MRVSAVEAQDAQRTLADDVAELGRDLKRSHVVPSDLSSTKTRPRESKCLFLLTCLLRRIHLMRHPVSWILQGTSPDMPLDKFSPTLPQVPPRDGASPIKTWMATTAKYLCSPFRGPYFLLKAVHIPFRVDILDMSQSIPRVPASTRPLISPFRSLSRSSPVNPWIQKTIAHFPVTPLNFVSCYIPVIVIICCLLVE